MKYQIWNGTDAVYTPGIDPAHGRMDYTADEWKDRYPWTRIPGESCVLATGVYNGGFCMPLSEMVLIANNSGALIDTALTPEEQLAAVEAFEDARNAPAEGVSNEELTATSLASIAASMEYQNMMTLPDEEIAEDTTTTEDTTTEEITEE